MNLITLASLPLLLLTQTYTLVITEKDGTITRIPTDETSIVNFKESEEPETPVLGTLVTKLQVELKNGSKEVFLLADAPEITFNGDQCVIECNSFTTSYDMADIVQAVFLDNTNSVEAPVEEKVTVDLSNPSKAVISGVAPATRINVYNVTGAIVASACADRTGTAELDLTDLQRGTVYIVSVNADNNFKLIKK